MIGNWPENSREEVDEGIHVVVQARGDGGLDQAVTMEVRRRGWIPARFWR